MATPLASEGRPDQIKIDDLLLDAENPRLAAKGQARPAQDEMIKTLWTEMAVDEVAFSIAANGFYPQEALFVIPDSKTKGAPYTVIEGNRRLAAVRLLREAPLRTVVKATELPQLNSAQRKALDELPVLVFSDRKRLWAYLGFRHVNGTKPWDALSKAEFVAGVHEKYGVSLDEIASRIGDRHSTVERFYRGYTVLKQAEGAGIFDRSDLWRNRFYFSHLYTALDQPEFKKFLGIRSGVQLVKNPIPRSKLRDLEAFLVWLYGKRSENIEPVVRKQNPDLNNLRRVIADHHALSLLRQGFALERAFEVSQGDAARFRDAVVRAKDALQRAKGTVTTGFGGEQDLLQTVDDIVTTATSILDEMKQKASKSQRSRS